MKRTIWTQLSYKEMQHTTRIGTFHLFNNYNDYICCNWYKKEIKILRNLYILRYFIAQAINIFFLTV